MTTSNVTRWGLLIVVASFGVPAPGAHPTIDDQLKQLHQDAGVSPTDTCDDATFIRRLTLDLVGRVPSESELQRFLSRPDREAAVDRMLANDQHHDYWSHLWTSMLVGRGEPDQIERETLRRWLAEQFADDHSIAQTCYELISAKGTTSLNGPVNFVVANRQDLVRSVARTFLSVQLDCAQCHDHPYDRWTNEDYRSLQRFFEPVQVRQVSGGVAVGDGVPDGDAGKPMFLTGREPHTSAWRRELALMVVQSKPFSRSMVNRTWHWLMGRGLIEPVDGLSRDNPAVAPELLETLAADLRAQDFRLSLLIKRICLSDAYQRRPTDETATDRGVQETSRKLFASRTIRPLTPEQWIQSVTQILGAARPTPAELAERARRLAGLRGQRSFSGDPLEWSATSQTLIGQLSMQMPVPLQRADRAGLESMFLSTLARKPSEDEIARIEGHDPEEVIFALLHCNEFVIND